MDDMVEKTMQSGLSLGMNKKFRFQNNVDKFTTYALIIEIIHDDIVDNYQQYVQDKHKEHIKNVNRILFSLNEARANVLDMRDIVNVCERRNDV